MLWVPTQPITGTAWPSTHAPSRRPCNGVHVSAGTTVGNTTTSRWRAPAHRARWWLPTITRRARFMICSVLPGNFSRRAASGDAETLFCAGSVIQMASSKSKINGTRSSSASARSINAGPTSIASRCTKTAS